MAKEWLKDASLSQERRDLISGIIAALERMEADHEAEIEDLLYHHEEELDYYR